MKFALTLLILITLSSCKSEKTQANDQSAAALKAEIKIIDDSLKLEFKNAMASGRMVSGTKMSRTIDAYLNFYRKFPKDEYAPYCLDKVQGLHMQNNNILLSLSYSDTLLNNYPKYENRFVILESQGSNYDVFEEYRDTNLVRKYYSLLLKEHKKITAEKQKDIQYRLDHLDLTFEELIELRIKESSK